MEYADGKMLSPLKVAIEEVARISPYPEEAYFFVLETLIAYTNAHDLFHQLVGDEGFFCDYLHDSAINRFGPETKSSLAAWSIRSGTDVGEIYSGLVAKGLIESSEVNLIEYFESGLDFETNEFKKLKRPELFTKNFQWRISSLFFITTLAAVAAAGASKFGVSGGIATLFAFWVGGIGIFSLVTGMSNRNRGWQFSVVTGIVLLAAGIFAFYLLVFFRDA